MHSEQTIIAAKFGVNVMTEKPMATRWKDGLRMVKACDEARVHLFVVKQNRQNATLQLLKHAIEEKRFGRMHLVHLNVFWTRPQSYYDQAKWRGTWEFDGGAFINQASHYVDLLDWLIGPVEKLQAMMSTTRDIEMEDTGVLNVRWRSGTLGSMSVTMLTYPRNTEASITILCEKGTARVGGVAVNEIQHWCFDEPKDYDQDVTRANYETTSVYGFGHQLYYKNVIDTLLAATVLWGLALALTATTTGWPGMALGAVLAATSALFTLRGLSARLGNHKGFAHGFVTLEPDTAVQY